MPSYSNFFSVAALLLLPFAAATPISSASPQSTQSSWNAKPANDTPDAVGTQGSPFAYNNSIIVKSLPLDSGDKKLPEPAGLVLRYITIGRGVQNYTCATSTPKSVPVATGK